MRAVIGCSGWDVYGEEEGYICVCILYVFFLIAPLKNGPTMNTSLIVAVTRLGNGVYIRFDGHSTRVTHDDNSGAWHYSGTVGSMYIYVYISCHQCASTIECHQLGHADSYTTGARCQMAGFNFT